MLPVLFVVQFVSAPVDPGTEELDTAFARFPWYRRRLTDNICADVEDIIRATTWQNAGAGEGTFSLEHVRVAQEDQMDTSLFRDGEGRFLLRAEICVSGLEVKQEESAPFPGLMKQLTAIKERLEKPDFLLGWRGACRALSRSDPPEIPPPLADTAPIFNKVLLSLGGPESKHAVSVTGLLYKYELVIVSPKEKIQTEEGGLKNFPELVANMLKTLTEAVDALIRSDPPTDSLKRDTFRKEFLPELKAEGTGAEKYGALAFGCRRGLSGLKGGGGRDLKDPQYAHLNHDWLTCEEGDPLKGMQYEGRDMCNPAREKLARLRVPLPILQDPAFIFEGSGRIQAEKEALERRLCSLLTLQNLRNQVEELSLHSDEFGYQAGFCRRYLKKEAVVFVERRQQLVPQRGTPLMNEADLSEFIRQEAFEQGRRSQ
uniref:Uncharacterized protein n=1 Tax=Chromera velia CCMP2878 TaxID=1169474 RepID=A0A0G4HPA1_9ALVE|eukprot:Cvel_29680.t1-p1 / transcript=Cvel_29680.t1 / gene=Cvel_29680 / organism=Chromera_velia_CCMP2878 / gene_product=hypothetical protein / transcript_product=hypothetical protein / location=Cvel_scaffold4106:2753-6108(-) / protein_length=428 / sequence_SO=supercontig / SO=protein_coding / is_pseudo=false